MVATAASHINRDSVNARLISQCLLSDRKETMNSFMDELASLLSTYKAKSHTLDTLSVLRMVVQHLNALSGEKMQGFKKKVKKIPIQPVDLVSNFSEMQVLLPIGGQKKITNLPSYQMKSKHT